MRKRKYSKSLDQLFAFRISKAMLEAIEAEAKLEQRPSSVWLRRLIARELKHLARLHTRKAEREKGAAAYLARLKAEAEARVAAAKELRAKLPSLEAAREKLRIVTNRLVLEHNIHAPEEEDAVIATVIVQQGDPDTYARYVKRLEYARFPVAVLELALIPMRRQIKSLQQYEDEGDDDAVVLASALAGN